jgi:hypothetical protein
MYEYELGGEEVRAFDCRERRNPKSVAATELDTAEDVEKEAGGL